MHAGTVLSTQQNISVEISVLNTKFQPTKKNNNK
uniref:Uncharacterized protein n=1 Tax=Anguilla anguilla TaxID=7936 RepID=A0A0E9SB48_ANGAN